jgi:hypothetical protein
MVSPLKEIISEKDFLEIFQKQTSEIMKICAYLNEKESEDSLFTKRFYGNVTTQARILEDFLDDYGAKNNRTWVYFRELVASARYMGYCSYMIQHIRNRYALYDVRNIKEKEFLEKTGQTQEFLNTAIKSVFKSICDEGTSLGLPIPGEKLKEEDFLDIASNKMLPHNLGEDFSSREEENVVKIATEYLNILRDHEDLLFDRRHTVQEIAALIPEHLSEEKLRKFELRVHSLQSLYDTYLKNTKIETIHPSLNSMRGFISVALHLAETATALIHFYERHESELRQEKVRESIERIIDKEMILDCIVNYCLFYCLKHLTRGITLAQSFLKSFVVIDSIRVPIPVYMGFHVRPATMVMKIVKHYGSDVRMQIGSEEYDAGSALDIFRANEKISAQKRQLIFEKIIPPGAKGDIKQELIKQMVCEELDRLVTEGLLLSFDELKVEDLTCETEEATIHPEEFRPMVAKEIKRLMAAGKIDIKIDIYATFKGDRRALKDIEALARANYGEDLAGNNIDLPTELEYLRK